MLPVLTRTLHARDPSLPYAVWLPPGFTTERRWPLLLFLHGAGERGADGRRQTTVGIGPALQHHPARFPAIVAMPQCPAVSHWSRETVPLLALLDELARSYPVDEARVYVTGISMGGNGAFVLAAADPCRFAAAVPICGWGDPQGMAARLRELPVWVLHGALDEVIPAEHSRAMVRALKAAGNETVRYTEFPDLAHESWDAAYADERLSTWLFAQHRAPDIAP